VNRRHGSVAYGLNPLPRLMGPLTAEVLITGDGPCARRRWSGDGRRADSLAQETCDSGMSTSKARWLCCDVTRFFGGERRDRGLAARASSVLLRAALLGMQEKEPILIVQSQRTLPQACTPPVDPARGAAEVPRLRWCGGGVSPASVHTSSSGQRLPVMNPSSDSTRALVLI
jgi:hypothetical protein